MRIILGWILGASSILAAALAPGWARAVEPPSCGTEKIWPDLSGFYAVTGTCGDAWCPQVLELVRWDDAYCRFDIEDGDPSCSIVDVDERGDVYNPVSFEFCAGGLQCDVNGPELPEGGMQFEGCRWYDFEAGVNVDCEALTLTPVEGPMPPDNHRCRAEAGTTGGESSGTSTGAADDSAGGGDVGPTTTGVGSVSSTGVPSGSGGLPSTDSGDMPLSQGEGSGCGCRSSSSPRAGLAGLLGLLLWRRRSARPGVASGFRLR